MERTTESIWPLLLSGVLGVLLGGVVQVVVNRYVAFKEGQSIASAIKAEIKTLLSVWEGAEFEKTVDGYIKRLAHPSTTLHPLRSSNPTHNDVFVFGANPKPFQVFDSLCNKIRVLGDLSAEIVGFYGLGKALLTNLSILWDIRERLLARKITIERGALLGQTRHTAQLYRELRDAGNRVADALAAYERQRWVPWRSWKFIRQ